MCSTHFLFSVVADDGNDDDDDNDDDDVDSATLLPLSSPAEHVATGIISGWLYMKLWIICNQQHISVYSVNMT